ncbi:phosphotransferase [Steroidobacter sp.]|uniref:phosphotransferase n=1 Tax=Steroidobacter sp. TaxID=1978227 RepID=UPI001A44D94D|nr:phosphotransferase [Steroidobacter sp.]MBL8267775.1 phosphotransferase [Steroidobacter sp.]
MNDLDLLLAELSAATTRTSEEVVAALVRDRYGLSAEVERLTGERDENFLVREASGSQYVLKIANLAEDPQVTDFQIAALLHLQAAEPDLPCPRVRLDLRGQTQTHFQDSDGTTRSARMLSFLSGKPLRFAERSTAQRQSCAILAATMGRALRSFEHAGAHRPLLWDVRHLPKLRQLLLDLPGLPGEATMLPLIDQFDSDVAPRLAALRQQVIHNDINDRNVIVQPDDDSRIAGFIDFGDMLHTALIVDVAIMIAEQITDTATLEQTANDLARAYHATVPLLDDEFALLKPLIAARMIMSVVIPSWHRQQHPSGQHYARVDHDFVRRRIQLLEQLLRTDIELS